MGIERAAVQLRDRAAIREQGRWGSRLLGTEESRRGAAHLALVGQVSWWRVRVIVSDSQHQIAACFMRTGTQDQTGRGNIEAWSVTHPSENLSLAQARVARRRRIQSVLACITPKLLGFDMASCRTPSEHARGRCAARGGTVPSACHRGSAREDTVLAWPRADREVTRRRGQASFGDPAKLKQHRVLPLMGSRRPAPPFDRPPIAQPILL